MNPTLKKLSKVGLSKSEIANLMQKHIGDGTNEGHCKEAFDAIQRIAQENPASSYKVFAELLRGDNYCESIQKIINSLLNDD